MDMTIPPPIPDQVMVYRDAAGEWRWRRTNGHNGKIVSDSGEGYVDRSFCVTMAEKVNGGQFVITDEATS